MESFMDMSGQHPFFNGEGDSNMFDADKLKDHLSESWEARLVIWQKKSQKKHRRIWDWTVIT